MSTFKQYVCLDGNIMTYFDYEYGQMEKYIYFSDEGASFLELYITNKKPRKELIESWFDSNSVDEPFDDHQNKS